MPPPQLATLRALHSLIQQAAEEFRSSYRGLPAAIPEDNLLQLKTTAAEIQALVLDLDNLGQSFHASGNAKKKVSNVLRWQWKKNAVAVLCARAARSRADLHLMMTMLSFSGQK